MVHLVGKCHVDIAGQQEYRPGFPLADAATTALWTGYKCYQAPGTGLQVALVIHNKVVPFVLETMYTHRGGWRPLYASLEDRIIPSLRILYVYHAQLK